jgi:hypothetical protein
MDSSEQRNNGPAVTAGPLLQPVPSLAPDHSWIA